MRYKYWITNNNYLTVYSSLDTVKASKKCRIVLDSIDMSLDFVTETQELEVCGKWKYVV